jgi:hypothetical protein
MVENACDLYRQTGRIDPELVSTMKEADLLTLKTLVDSDLTRIKAQIDEAKGKAAEMGVYSDGAWFRKATSAIRIKGLLSQRIQTELGKRRKERKAPQPPGERPAHRRAAAAGNRRGAA